MGGYRDTTAPIEEGKYYDHANDQALVAQVICAPIAQYISTGIFYLCRSTDKRGVIAGIFLLFFSKRPAASTRRGSSDRGKRARGYNLLND